MKKISLLVLVSMLLMLVFASCTLLVDPDEPTDGDNNSDSNVEHIHEYSTDWSYNSTKHYHACTCGEKNEVADHTAGDDGKCTVCGYQVSEPAAVYTVTVVATENVTVNETSVELKEGETAVFTVQVNEEYNLFISGPAISAEPTVENGVKTYTVYVTHISSDVTINLSATLAPCSHSWTEATCTAVKVCSLCGVTEGDILGHDWTAPTCTSPKTCDRCGVTYGSANGHTGGTATCENLAVCDVCGESYGDLAAHEWGDISCTDDAVCTVCGAAGDAAVGHKWNDPDCTTPKTCSVCGETEGEALGHDWVAPTCTMPGYCKACYEPGESSTGHSWTDATCTEAKTCAGCGETIGNALGHTWSDATCDTPKTCSTCGDTDGDVAPHKYVAVVTAPTCTADGYTTYTCSACGDSYTSDSTDALGHSAPAATCTVDSVCTVCGTKVADATGHSYVSNVKEPTCTAVGYTVHTCHNCGDTYTDNRVSATGHSGGAPTCNALAVCTACGESYGDYASHNYDAVVTAPTCTTDGFTTHICTTCEDSYVDSTVSALGHKHNAVVTAPTCTEAGYTTYTCACGDTYTANEIPATGHSHEAVVTAPTCTEAGYTTYTCACGDTYTANEIPATGHNHNAVVTAPTCTEAGYTTYTCACGDSYTTDNTNPTGHSWVDATHEAPKTCTSCGATEGEAIPYELVLGENVYRVSTDENGNSIDIGVKFIAPAAGKYKVTTRTEINGLALFNGVRLADAPYEFEVTEDALEVTFKVGNANRNNPGYTNDIYIVVEEVVEQDVELPAGAIEVFVSDGMGITEIVITEAGTYSFATNIENASIVIVTTDEENMYDATESAVELAAETYYCFIVVYDENGDIVPLEDGTFCWVTCEIFVDGQVKIDVPVSEGMGLTVLELSAGTYNFTTNIENASVIIVTEDEENMYDATEDAIEVADGIYYCFIVIYDENGDLVPLEDGTVCWVAYYLV